MKEKRVPFYETPCIRKHATHGKLESSQSPHTSAKAMWFARWQHHLRFCSDFPYAPLKAIVTKISNWSRFQDSFRITHKIESLVVCVIPNIPSKFQKDPSITFWVILLTHRQTDKQTKTGKNITSLAGVKMSEMLKRVICKPDSGYDSVEYYASTNMWQLQDQNVHFKTYLTLMTFDPWPFDLKIWSVHPCPIVR